MQNTSESLKRIGNNLKLKSDELVVKKEVHQDLEQRHTELVEKIDQSRKEQVQLDDHVQDINDQWLSKRMKITHDTKTIKDLQENISDVKLKRRERLEKERKRTENEVDHRRNYNTTAYNYN